MTGPRRFRRTGSTCFGVGSLRSSRRAAKEYFEPNVSMLHDLSIETL
jgi:hypothetical protein